MVGQRFAAKGDGIENPLTLTMHFHPISAMRRSPTRKDIRCIAVAFRCQSSDRTLASGRCSVKLSKVRSYFIATASVRPHREIDADPGQMGNPWDRAQNLRVELRRKELAPPLQGCS